MPIGWYIIPYKRRPNRPIPSRYPEIDDYSDQIRVAGGQWSETEVLGDRCIVKVRAPVGVLNAIDAVPGFKRIPRDRLDDSLSDLPVGVRTALRNEVLSMGYTEQEVHDRFGSDLGSYTLRQVLRFMATRRLDTRYDSNSDEIILDGQERTPRTIESVDLEVMND
jgi:hypothetical protein